MGWTFNASGTGLMLLALAVLTIGGVVFNNLSNTGFTNTVAYTAPNNTTCTSLQCPAYSSVTACTTPSQCQLGTFTFLTQASPFTQLFQGNLVGFFIQLFTQQENLNVIYSGYTICIPQINAVYANQSGPDIHNFQCLGYSASGVGNHPFPQVGPPLNATSNVGNSSTWQVLGCQLTNKNYPCMLNYGNGIESWNGTTGVQGFNAIYVLNGTTLTATSGCTVYGSKTTCNILFPFLFHVNPSFTCPNTAHVNGLNINATHYYCLLPYENQNSSATNTATAGAMPNSFAGISWLFGAILLFLGFGLAISTTLIGFSLNAQGTRLAQVFGLGLFIFIPFLSEFGGWFGVGVVGTALSVLITFLLGGTFFFGLYQQTTLGTTGA